MKKDYTNGDITVRWRPDKCIHSKKCWKELSSVFQPRNKPWINMEGANSAAISAQVSKCPSGALSIVSDEMETKDEVTRMTVDITKNGPILVKGNVEINMPDGGTQFKSKVTAFCRCGASKNKPYCDGSHNAINFEA